MHLIKATPAKFTDKHLRTIQRAVKVWRGEMAQRLILDGFTRLAATATVPRLINDGG
jgi:hypothetical protein